jgi:hypothetical protein
VNIMATITVKDLAETLDTDARTTRKFLRSVTPKDAQPGKGGRWEIERKSVASYKKQFAKFAAAAAERAAKATEPEVAEDEVIEIED